MVRFLADESCDFAVVRALRSAGQDVRAVAEMSQGAADPDVIRLAVREGRVLITEDTDFGELVYAHGQESAGVILLRFPAGARARLASQVLAFVEQHEDKLVGAFVVLQPGRARISHAH